ncbi:DciA family protein [Rickettsiales bacterium]|nr:DciA family protein [Rickettsiales bacterium]
MYDNPNIKYLPGPRKIGYALDKATKPVLSKRGFIHSKLIADWDKIVGPVLGEYSSPQKISFWRDANINGTLYIEIYDSGMATELTYLEPVIIEKIAVYFGYKAIAKLKLLQNPGSMPKAVNNSINKKKTVKEPSLSLLDLVKDIDDDVLRNSLIKLGSTMEI